MFLFKSVRRQGYRRPGTSDDVFVGGSVGASGYGLAVLQYSLREKGELDW